MREPEFSCQGAEAAVRYLVTNEATSERKGIDRRTLPAVSTGPVKRCLDETEIKFYVVAHEHCVA